MVSSAAQQIPWSAGRWTNPPAAVVDEGDALVVTAALGSDAWRHTAYGFVHDSEHALVAPFRPLTAVEVEFTAPFAEQFDQAGVFVRASAEHWVKAGVEFADGALQVGAVVTDGFSDWSVAPVDDWLGRRIRVRVSWADGAMTVRAGLADDDAGMRLVRVLPFAEQADAMAGPFVNAPTRAGFTTTFTSWRTTPADAALH